MAVLGAGTAAVSASIFLVADSWKVSLMIIRVVQASIPNKKIVNTCMLLIANARLEIEIAKLVAADPRWAPLEIYFVFIIILDLRI